MRGWSKSGKEVADEEEVWHPFGTRPISSSSAGVWHLRGYQIWRHSHKLNRSASSYLDCKVLPAGPKATPPPPPLLLQPPHGVCFENTPFGFEFGKDDADSAAEDGRAILTIIAFVVPLISRNRGCRKRDEGQTNQRSHAEGFGGSPSKQLFLSPSLEPRLPPPHSLGCVWYAAHVSGTRCVFPSCRLAGWTGGLSVALFCYVARSHRVTAPGLPSCLGSGPSLQCRMGDNLLIVAPSGCRTIRPTPSVLERVAAKEV